MTTPVYSWDDYKLFQALASSPRHERTGAMGWHWWLVRSGRVVGYAKTVYWPAEPGLHLLMDVEVRKDERCRGHVRELLLKVGWLTQAPVHSSGNWTADGAKALGFLPLAPDSIPGVYYRETAFVKDWDRMESRYP